MIKKYVALFIVIVGGLLCVPDVASLKTAWFAASCICLLAGALMSVIGLVDNWGLLPELDFSRIVSRSTETPQSCAVIAAGFLIFLGLVVLAVFKAQ